MRAQILKGPAWTAVLVSAVLAIGATAAVAEPLHIALPGHFAQQPTIAQCQSMFGINCYDAAEMRHAYGVDQLNAFGLTGRGQTIVLVDSYGSPTIQSDLQTFDEDNNLPAPPSFDILTPVGTPPAWNPTLYPDQPGWAEETTLDVEWAHAIAPGAKIIEVETPVDETEGVQGLPQMMQAEQYVVDHHLASVISQSFGATEQTFQDSNGNFDPQQIYQLRYAFEDAAAHGVTVLAASGDAGATDYELDLSDFYPKRAIDWPSSDPLVTSVGGLELQLDSNGNRTATDQVWNDTLPVCGPPCAGGGGVSSVFSRPFFQDGVRNVVGDQRGTPDVSMSASVSGAVNIYESFPGVAGSWSPIAGTSEASPLFAGEVALADQAAGHPLGNIDPLLYELGDGRRSGLTDITIGNNTVTWTQPSTGQSLTVQGYNAVAGYDLASGLGEANTAFPLELARLANGNGQGQNY